MASEAVNIINDIRKIQIYCLYVLGSSVVGVLFLFFLGGWGWGVVDSHANSDAASMETARGPA